MDSRWRTGIGGTDRAVFLRGISHCLRRITPPLCHAIPSAALPTISTSFDLTPIGEGVWMGDQASDPGRRSAARFPAHHDIDLPLESPHRYIDVLSITAVHRPSFDSEEATLPSDIDRG